MLTKRQRLRRTSTVIASVTVGLVCLVVTPASAAGNRLHVKSVVITEGGAALVVTGSYDCPGQGSPFGFVAVSQNVGSGRIQSQFDYPNTPRCSRGKSVTFTDPLLPPTQDNNPGDPQYVANVPWRTAPLIVSISMNNSGLSRVVTPSAGSVSSPAIRPTGQVVAYGAGAAIGLTVSCGQPAPAPPGQGFLDVQLTQVIRNVAQTTTGYPNVVCDGRPHQLQYTVATQALPWRPGPAFVVVTGDFSAFGGVELVS